ncbi:Sec1 domain-containing protein 2 [Gonapodya sp. JEL0774]|nr:Sec1 domain-containing protein 2 [Gonapodya sp. JEL0774]
MSSSPNSRRPRSATPSASGSPVPPHATVPPSLLTTATDRVFTDKNAPWLKACDGSVVYIDAGAAASLAWNLQGGVAGLLDAGATTVRDVEDMQSNLEKRNRQKKAGALFSFSTCSVFSAVSEDAHRFLREEHVVTLQRDLETGALYKPESDLAQIAAVDWLGFPASFAAVEALIVEWINENPNRRHSLSPAPAAAHIGHAPLAWAQITPSLFITTGTERVWPGTGMTGNATNPLSLLLDSLHVQDHLFALGPASLELARYLARTSTDRGRRTSARMAGVVVVDRTLDLSSPLSHPSHPLHLAFSLLPVSNLQPLLPAVPLLPATTPATSFRFSPARAGSADARDAWGEVVGLPEKEGLAAMRRRVAEEALAASSEGVDKPPKMLGRATSAQLIKLLSLFHSVPDAIIPRSSILTLAAAVATVLEHPLRERWEEIQAAEKVLALAAAEASGGGGWNSSSGAGWDTSDDWDPDSESSTALSEAAAVIAAERDRCTARGDRWTWDRVREVCGLAGYAMGLGHGVVGEVDETRWEIEVAGIKEALVGCVLEAWKGLDEEKIPDKSGTTALAEVKVEPVEAVDPSGDWDVGGDEIEAFDADWAWGEEKGDAGGAVGAENRPHTTHKSASGTPLESPSWSDYAERERRRRIAAEWVGKALDKMVEAAKLRGRLARYRPNPTATNPNPLPLVARIVSDVLAPNYVATSASGVAGYGSKFLASVQATATAGETFEADMWHVSYGIMNYLGNMGVGGISRFLATNISTRARGGSATPVSSTLHPAGQYPVLIVYVLGGISFHEVQAIQDAVKAANRSDVEVIVGATGISTPKTLIDHVFGDAPKLENL